MSKYEVVADAEACFQSGNRNFNLGHYQEAIQAYKDAIRINPECHEAYFNLGLAYCMLGHYQEAVQAYKKCLLMKRNDAKAYTCLGKTYVELGDHNEAAEAFEAAIRIEPGCPDAHSNLGRAYNSLKRYEEAVQVLMEAIRIKPDHAEAHNNLGWAYGGLRRYAKAAEAFKEAIRIKPDYDEAHFGLGVTYGLLGDWDSALGEYEILRDLSMYLADKFLKLIKKWWLIKETTAEVMKETEFDDASFDNMTREESEMLFKGIAFGIKARITESLAGVGVERLKEHFYSIDRMVKDMKQRCFIRKGTIH
ncbi:MAG: tetratricopeptide repeat protein [Desulfobacterales bacterium]|nr:tetratricopeptide repeat protein [Desulfobacterales bacterium]